MDDSKFTNIDFVCIILNLAETTSVDYDNAKKIQE